MVNVYLERLEKLEIGKFSTVIDYDNQFSVLKLCDKKNEINQVQKEIIFKISYTRKNLIN